MDRKEIPCYCCGNPCYGHTGSSYDYTCQPCAFEVQGLPADYTGPDFDPNDPKDGNGYPIKGSAYREELNALRARKMGTQTHAPTVHSGMNCCGCGDYNDYGQPNQSGGQYKCYRCRR